MIYSTVTKGRYRCANLINNSDLFFSFDLTTRSTGLNKPHYTEYQYFLHDTISDLFDKGMNFKEIADWLNDNGYKTPRGKKFRNGHTHSIIKKKKISDNKFSAEYLSEIKNCSLDCFEKTLING